MTATPETSPVPSRATALRARARYLESLAQNDQLGAGVAGNPLLELRALQRTSAALALREEADRLEPPAPIAAAG